MEFLKFLMSIMGICGWILHLIFILTSIRSEDKWTVLIDYNRLHEGKVEVILIVIMVILGFIALI